MSRVAKTPVIVPDNVDIKLANNHINVQSGNTTLAHEIHESVAVNYESNVLYFEAKTDSSWAQAGTERVLVNNMILGVTKGFEKRLQLQGVGYRAQMRGTELNLALGYSHDVNYSVPLGISIEVPSQTEVVIKGANKQQVGQVAAEIRAYRPPEPYKGKGVRYANERVRRKEVKKTK